MRILLAIFFMCTVAFSISLDEEFYNIDDNKVKKVEFIKALLPLMEKKNREIMDERYFVETFFKEGLLIRANDNYNKVGLQRLIALSKKYKISNLYNKNEYLEKIDTIPLSMALSQAALESGWGGSIYAREYNNLFGHYTFARIDESVRVSGKRERIRVFTNIESSIESYLLNINSHWAYASFREERAKARGKNESFSGTVAIKHMLRYSEIGSQYAVLLKNIINENKLFIYDKLYATTNNKETILLQNVISADI